MASRGRGPPLGPSHFLNNGAVAHEMKPKKQQQLSSPALRPQLTTA
jgi:hypothetical protein